MVCVPSYSVKQYRFVLQRLRRWRQWCYVEVWCAVEVLVLDWCDVLGCDDGGGGVVVTAVVWAPAELCASQRSVCARSACLGVVCV
jgi:hypothetical protein